MKQHILFILILPALLACTSQKPVNLGLENSRFAPCPSSPNCVSSMSDEADKEHYIAPISYNGNTEDAYNIMLTLLKNEKGCIIITNEVNYIHAEYTTPVMKFIDDVQFYFPKGENSIHIKSSSRIGYSDMGTNRKRVENIRSKFKM